MSRIRAAPGGNQAFIDIHTSRGGTTGPRQNCIPSSSFEAHGSADRRAAATSWIATLRRPRIIASFFLLLFPLSSTIVTVPVQSFHLPSPALSISTPTPPQTTTAPSPPTTPPHRPHPPAPPPTAAPPDKTAPSDRPLPPPLPRRHRPPPQQPGSPNPCRPPPPLRWASAAAAAGVAGRGRSHHGPRRVSKRKRTGGPLCCC